MSIKELPKTFRTSDGQTFEDEGAAKRHEELITTRDDFERAQRRFGKLLAETQLTADGNKFEFGLFRTYYYIERHQWGVPSLSEVPYLGSDWGFDDSDGFIIRYRRGNEGRVIEFKISEMYEDRRAADKELLKVQEEFIAEYIEKTRSERVRLYPEEESTPSI